MKPNTFIDISGFKQVVQGLQKITGKSFKEVLEAETGMILAGAIRMTPKATAKKIVKRTMPEGHSFRGGVGGRIVTFDEGKHYHVGEPVLGNNGRFKKPYTYWMNKKGGSRDRWGKWVAEQKEKTIQRILRRGLSASQFYWMSVLLNIKLAKFPPKYIMNPKNFKILKRFLAPHKGAVGKSYQITMASSGFKMSGRTNAQRVLMIATKAREKFFQRAVKKELVKDMKTFMPKSYPLLFK